MDSSDALSISQTAVPEMLNFLSAPDLKFYGMEIV